MVTDFILLTIERYRMSTTKTKEEKVLTANDRCDRCGAQAYVKVTGMSGELMFCSHDYNKIMNDSKAKEAMDNFAYETLDEREFVYDK
jgi:hypothetical protein